MRLFTVLLLLVFAFNAFAGNKKTLKVNKVSLSKKEIKGYSIAKYLHEPVDHQLNNEDQKLFKNTQTQIESRNGEHFYTAKIDSSRNGFGWLNAGIRSLDRYKGTDASFVDVDFLALGYRQFIVSNPATGIIGATTINVADGLQAGTYYRHVELNQDIAAGTVGGRYPGVVALDRPFIAFNQYISGNADTSPAISSPYLITDFLSYGDNGGLWTSSMKMDEGYQHDGFDQNRLWNGSVSIVKSSDETYHYAGVYRNWTISGESQPHEYVILNAESADPTSGWTIDTTPALVDTMDFMLYPVLSMNKNGFGACVGIGHQGPHAGDTFYMSELRIMVKATQDYGKTWTATREVSWAELGIPENIEEADSILVPANPDDPNDTTYVVYSGPAYLAIPNNHALDVVVSEDDDIYVGFDLTWGPQAGESSYYRNAAWCGVHAAISNDGGENFHDSHIAINNGFFVGDSSSADAGDNFVFDSEVDLSLDEAGNIYATWLDRPNTDIEVAEHLRYDRPNQEILLKTDVYTARSLDGGENWSWKMNVTNTKSVDEYELKAARLADRSGNGKIYFAYCTIDPNTSVEQGLADSYTYRTNRIWVGEGFNYPDSDLVSIDDGQPVVSRDFTLDQNYPNPFNPATSIRYHLAAAARVQLTVYNMLGQKIRTLVNEKQNAGAYKVQFDGTDLASGIYFYRLYANGKTQIRKMILMK